MLQAALTWAQNHTELLGLVSAASITLLCVSLFLTPWLVSTLPADYFCETEKQPQARSLMLSVLRNVVGIIVVLSGVLMIFIPGPGLISVVVGLSICEFSAKQRLLRRLVGHPPVFRSLNWMRARHQKVPFSPPVTLR